MTIDKETDRLFRKLDRVERKILSEKSKEDNLSRRINELESTLKKIAKILDDLPGRVLDSPEIMRNLVWNAGVLDARDYALGVLKDSDVL